MEKEELKPCPLCNAKARHYMSAHKHNVGCTKCCVKIKGYMSKAEAITAWNTRPSPWIAITPETDFEADTEYLWYKKGRNPMFGDIELHFEGGYDFTHYMPIPTLPDTEK